MTDAEAVESDAKEIESDARAAGDDGDAVEAADDPETGAERPDHLDDLADGCGCAEVWEHLSERRGRASED